MYLGVDDVDACVAAITGAGRHAHLAALDIPNVGRIAMVSDPQGAPFYVMRGASDEKCTACEPDRAGHGAWHLSCDHFKPVLQFVRRLEPRIAPME